MINKDKKKSAADSSKKITWHLEKRKLSDLIPWEGNPRQGTEKQKADLHKSIEQFGLAEPIVINTDNLIIGGHFRYVVLKEQGVKQVDVMVPSRKLTKAEYTRLNIRLNLNTGSWDFDILANFESDLLVEVGFSEEEQVEIFGLDDKEPKPLEEFKKIDESKLSHTCPKCGFEFDE